MIDPRSNIEQYRDAYDGNFHGRCGPLTMSEVLGWQARQKKDGTDWAAITGNLSSGGGFLPDLEPWAWWTVLGIVALAIVLGHYGLLVPKPYLSPVVSGPEKVIPFVALPSIHVENKTDQTFFSGTPQHCTVHKGIAFDISASFTRDDPRNLGGKIAYVHLQKFCKNVSENTTIQYLRVVPTS